MKSRIIIGLFLTLHVLSSHAQEQFGTKHIAPYTHYFTLGDDFSGEGWDYLEKEFEKAQFVLLGEYHNSRQISLFTNQLLKELSPYGFNQLAAEVGPESAKILKRLSDNPEETQGNLNGLYKKYKSKPNKYPIPFFKGVEDAAFLETARTLDYDLWGLDQEYYFAAPLLFDELMSTVNGHSDYENILKAKHVATNEWQTLKRKDSKKKPLNCGILKSEKINAFLDMFDANNQEAQNVIAALKKSWQIYCYHESRDRRSNPSRINYMRSNFLEHFKQYKEKNGEHPKVVTKMGNFHTSRIKSWIGYNDVGHLIEAIAEKYDYHVANLRFIRRYVGSTDKLGKSGYKGSETFMSIGEKTRWGFVDVRPLRAKIESGELIATKQEKHEIFNYDFIVIIPTDRNVKNNY